MRAENLFRVLYDIGARYRVVDGTLRFARGTLPTELRNEVARLKEDLLLGPCQLCGAELATHGERCAWCEAVRDREASYEPGSDRERAFLVALNAVELRQVQHAA